MGRLTTPPPALLSRVTLKLCSCDPLRVSGAVRLLCVETDKTHPSPFGYQRDHIFLECRKITPALAYLIWMMPQHVMPGVVETFTTAPVPVVPGVPGLPDRIRPADVTLLIVPVIIREPVKAHAIRSWSDQPLDVLRKAHWIMPAPADPDTARSVPGVLRITWVVAPVHHVAPRLIERVCLAQPVRCCSFPRSINRQAPARSGGLFPRQEVAERDFVHAAAITQHHCPALGTSLRVRYPDLLDHHAAANPVAGMNFKFPARPASSTCRKIVHGFSPALSVSGWGPRAVRRGIVWRPLHTHPTRTQVPDRQRHLSAGLSRGWSQRHAC